jgi:hypothetical protein
VLLAVRTAAGSWREMWHRVRISRVGVTSAVHAMLRGWKLCTRLGRNSGVSGSACSVIDMCWSVVYVKNGMSTASWLCRQDMLLEWTCSLIRSQNDCCYRYELFPCWLANPTTQSYISLFYHHDI